MHAIRSAAKITLSTPFQLSIFFTVSLVNPDRIYILYFLMLARGRKLLVNLPLVLDILRTNCFDVING